ncbi:MAG: cytochrome c peroxidase [Chromatiales bacterium]|jgi:cytochrome c peroxidase
MSPQPVIRRIVDIAAAVAAVTALGACNLDDSGQSDNPVLDARVRATAVALGLTGNPAAGRRLPDIGDPTAQLGMHLFFTKGLGGDLDSACVSCHHPVLGGGDDLPLSIGVEAEIPDLLGPGRHQSPSGTRYDGGPTVPRNAPTTFNTGLYDAFLFHDGRVESLLKVPHTNGAGPIRTPDSALGTPDPDAGPNLLTAQARFPVTSGEEMRGFTFVAGGSNAELRAALERRLQGVDPGLPANGWLALFRDAFGDPQGTAADLITFPNVAFAIAEYERSQVFVDTPWRAYLEGDDEAISWEAKQGALLFLRDPSRGGAGCAACHSGDFFTDERFHVLAVPQIGRGKGDDNGLTTTDDFGRFRVTADPADKYAFRTPTLLNAEATSPYGHSGAYATLEAMVRHHLDPRAAVQGYDFTQLESGVQVADMQTNTGFALQALEARQQAGTSLLRQLDLSDAEVAQLVAFLHALTDPCVSDRGCLAPWIPDPLATDPDQLRVRAVDQLNNPL